METLYNGFTLDIPAGVFPLSTDSMVLADFVRIGKAAKVLDLGSGCGTLGILLCAREDGCAVTGVEIDETAHRTALENIRRNGLQNRMDSVCADLRDFAGVCPPGSFTHCVSNPPYFSGGPASARTPDARREDLCDPARLFAAAAGALKWGGSFSLVHRPERLAELCFHAGVNRLQPKRLRLVRHHPGGPINLVLMECRKGGKPGLIIDEMYLFDPSGQPSDDYRRIYHL